MQINQEPKVEKKLLQVGFLASHGGSNMKSIVEAIKVGSLSANASVVISNNSNSEALKFGRREGVPSYHISNNTINDSTKLDLHIRDTLVKHGVDLVILSGYFKKIGPKTLEAFSGRIINIHPSLLPKYGGKGMYGNNVHKVVLEARETVTGVTVHIIDEVYDKGKILAQRKVDVLKHDSVHSLAKRVFHCEKQFLPEVIQSIHFGNIKLP
ncbi:phosphoribosylglycinamide formyltransferase [Bacillus sp. SCS-151]|uniref:phosphoribosylglycinamide formyltransferase n=1 Tax=Nanhaiella sioensis TaxID=3115293 RepID=UPI003978249A